MFFVSLTLCVKSWPVFLCLSNTVCQVLVCDIEFLDRMPCVGLVLVSLALCFKRWSVFLCLLHCVSSDGL